MKTIKKILDFVCLIGYDGKLSVTNLLVYTFTSLICYLAIVNHQLDLASVGVIIPVILNHIDRRRTNDKHATVAKDVKSQLDELTNKVQDNHKQINDKLGAVSGDLSIVQQRTEPRRS